MYCRKSCFGFFLSYRLPRPRACPEGGGSRGGKKTSPCRRRSEKTSPRRRRSEKTLIAYDKSGGGRAAAGVAGGGKVVHTAPKNPTAAAAAAVVGTRRKRMHIKGRESVIFVCVRHTIYAPNTRVYKGTTPPLRVL